MINTVLQHVASSIVEVMESMFNFVVHENKNGSAITNVDEIADVDSLRACKIDFHGTYSGNIYLLIPDNILIQMTNNFIGAEDTGLTEEEVVGTLKETLNMVAGDALTNVDETSYTGLGIPELIDPASLPFDQDFAVFSADQSLMYSFVELRN